MNTQLVNKLAQKAGHVHIPDAPFANSLQELYNQKLVQAVVSECMSVYQAIDNGNQVQGTRCYLTALNRHFGLDSKSRLSTQKETV
jgi:hypothetical protein